jgi:hypothetical protein
MKIFNTIVLYDTYVVANSAEEARKALKDWIHEGLNPSEEKAMEARDERNIRQSWRDQKPLVGGDVSDDDFEKHIKGHTTVEVFQHIYTKRG